MDAENAYINGQMQKIWFLGMAAMALIVLISNILVQYPINDWLTWGALSYPVCFLINDMINRTLGAKKARSVVYVGFVCGIILSYGFAGSRIALASGMAFLSAQLIDIAIFNRISKNPWWQAPFISSICASALDTVLFFSLAFAGTGLPWITWAIGDYIVKFIVAVIMLVPFRIILGARKKRKT